MVYWVEGVLGFRVRAFLGLRCLVFLGLTFRVRSV